jgi:VCBS repeat-containing protein
MSSVLLPVFKKIISCFTLKFILSCLPNIFVYKVIRQLSTYSKTMLLVFMLFSSSAAFAASPLCSSIAGNQSYEWVTRVAINGSAVNTGPIGYLDSTDSVLTTLTAGQSYTIEIDAKTNGTSYHEYVKVWFDYNQNSSIEDPAELAFEADATFAGSHTFSGSITIPADAYNGQMYARMIFQYNGSPLLCGNYGDGSTVDLLVNITGGQSNASNNTVTTTLAGSGTGAVSSSPEGLNCSSGSCNFDFAPSTTLIALTATADTGYAFTGWSGDCSGTANPLTLTVDGDKSCTASFGSANSAPILTVTQSSTLVEGTLNLAVVDADATDAENDTIIFSLTGTDENLFSIDASSGVISFKTLPSYDTPSDNGNNNIYDINVIASDGALNDTAALTITVQQDSDADGVPNLSDTDDDNDGVPDTVEITDGTDPLDENSWKDSDDSNNIPDYFNDNPLAFQCDATVYHSRGNKMYSVDTGTLPFTYNRVGPANGVGIKTNAVGFNYVDGFIYGMSVVKNERNHLVRVDASGNFIDLGVVTGLPNQGYPRGDVNVNGDYYVTDGKNIYVIDVNTVSVTNSAKLSANKGIDIAFNPVDGKVYSANHKQVRITDIANNTATSLTITGMPSDAGSFGSHWFDSAGNLFVSANHSEDVYRISNPGTAPVAEYVGRGTYNGSPFDAAACVAAPTLIHSISPNIIADTGATVTHTYELANGLPNNLATGFEDTLTDGRTFVAGTATITGSDTTVSLNAYAGTNVLSISNISVPLQGKVTITIDVEVPASVAGMYQNQAYVTNIPLGLGGDSNEYVYSDDAATFKAPDATSLEVQGPNNKISGYAFNDYDGDGIRDDNEPALRGVIITLNSSTVVLTDMNGFYQFTYIADGSNTIAATKLDAGYTAITPESVGSINLASGQSQQVNFAYTDGYGVINGNVFEDIDANGQQGQLEGSLAAVTVTLKDKTGNTLATTASDESGFYQFDDLLPTLYWVEATTPIGYFAVSSTQKSVSAVSRQELKAHFTYVEASSVSGIVFDDFNGDKSHNEFENVLATTAIDLYQHDGTFVASTVTNNAGQYVFTGLAANAYYVEETDPTDYTSTTANTVTINVPASGAAVVNFADQEVATVSGVVYVDDNLNGIQDSGEYGLAGVTVTLDNGISAITLISDENGLYQFESVIAGDYTLSSDNVTDYLPASDVEITLLPGGAASANFSYKIPGVISGRIFNDTDLAGDNDKVESGLAYYQVKLSRASTNSYVNTDENGYYQFDGLAPASYTVSFITPEGYITDSNNENIILATSESTEQNFPINVAGTISGHVYDTYTENGIAGSTITVNGGIGSTTTNANGFYLFNFVTNGSYTVTQTNATNYVDSGSNSATVTVSADSVRANFYDLQAGSVTLFAEGYVTGVESSAVEMLNGIDITFNGSTKSTDEKGMVTFAGITPATLTATAVLPAGYSSSNGLSQSITIGSGNASSATFTYRKEHAPIALTDSYSVNEGALLNVNVGSGVLSNDSDSNSDTLTAILVTNVINGTLALNSDGSFTYLHNGSETTSDSFTYKTNDTLFDSNTVTVSITVNPVNDLPTYGGDKTGGINEDGTTATGGLTISDNDSGESLVVAQTNATNSNGYGDFSIDTNGTWAYNIDNTNLNVQSLPNGDTLSESFTVMSVDGTTTQTVTITITGVNGVATITGTATGGINEDVTTAITGSLSIADEDTGEANFVVQTDAAGTYGDFSIDSAGAWSYALDNNNGAVQALPHGSTLTDSFVVSSQDGTDTQTVTITITGVNGVATITGTATGGINEDVTDSLTGTLTVSDEDTGEVGFMPQSLVEGVFGHFTIAMNGEWLYQLDNSNIVVQALPEGETLTDSFAVTSLDGTGSQMVTVTITGINDSAEIMGAAAGQIVANSKEVITGSLAITDIDTDQSMFISQADAQGLYGNFTLNSEGDWVYLINNSNTDVLAIQSGESLTDTFIVVSLDGTEQEIAITIDGINDSPTATQVLTLTVDEDGQLPDIDVLTLISDADGDTLIVTSATVIHGNVLINADNTINYQPAPDYFGSDILTYQVTDGVVTITETAVITVNPVNDVPIAQTDIAVTYQERAVVISVLDNDTDIDSNALTVTAINIDSSIGSAEIESNAITYTSTDDFVGSAVFTYTVTDGELTSSAQVEVVVMIDPTTIVNEHPNAVADEFIATDWAKITLDVLDNDSDPEGDSFNLISASADLGSVVIENGKLIYTPMQGQTEFSALEYSIVDSAGNVSIATVVVNFNLDDAALLPDITAPGALCGDLEVNANALYTRVNLGIATATDRFGNMLPVSLIDGMPLYPAGSSTAYWQATDAEGRASIAAQKVCINPLISLKKDQTVLEGEQVTIGVFLNGEAPEYPVVVPYTVSGTSKNTDHDLVSGEIVIESGTQARIIFNTIMDELADSEETIIVTLADTINRGAKYVHTIIITEANLAPEVQLNVQQAKEQRMLIVPTDGEVLVTADVYDANEGDTFRFDWSVVGANLTNTSTQSNEFSFDPSQLTLGTYQIELIVTDSAEQAKSDQAAIYIQVVEELVTLSNLDSDGDNIPDNLEGYADQDGDGVPDYLDRIDECNVLTEESSVQDGYLVEANPGVCLRRGVRTLTGETGGAYISDKDIEEKYVGISADNAAINIGGIFDFIAYGLPESSQTISIVLPQRKPIPENAVYRKLAPSGDWVTFMSDDDNTLWSTQGEPGYCPPPNTAGVWTKGLTAGHWCVQLNIVDGGNNDDDGELNGTVVDPGYVGVLITGNSLPEVVNESVNMSFNQSQVVIDVLANDIDADGDSLIITSVTANIGRAEILDGKITFFLEDAEGNPINYNGEVIIEYGISDGNGGSDSGQLTITIDDNQAPVTASTVEIKVKQALVAESINVVDVATDREGDSIELISASAEHGEVNFDSNGEVIYTPNPNYAGNDIITYQIRDAYGNIAQGTINVEVEPYQEISAKTESGGSISYLMVLWLLMIGIYRQKKVINLSKVAAVTLTFLTLTSISSQAANEDNEQPESMFCTSDQYVTADCPAYTKWFIGGQLGYSNSDVSDNELNQAFMDAGAIASSIDIDDSGMAWELFGGYQFTPNWALQVGYLDLGDRSLSFQGQTSDPDAFFDAVEHIYPDSGEGFKVAVIGSLPLTEHWKVSGRLALFNWSQDYNTNSIAGTGNDEIKGTDIQIGGEISYALRRYIQLYASYDWFEAEHHSADNLALGVRYFFGEDKPVIKKQPKIAVKAMVKTEVKAQSEPAVKVQPKSVAKIKPKAVLPENISIYFPIDQYVLNAENLIQFVDVRDILKSRDDIEITINGYASKIGNQERNHQLSIWRAHAVEKQLYLADIKLSRMNVDFHGDIEQPADPKGQRVDISFQWSKGNDKTEAYSTEIKFGMFSERVTTRDLEQINTAVDGQNLTKLHHVELISFSKPPGDRQGLIELAAKRVKKLTKLLKVRGVNVPIQLTYIMLEPNEQETERKVVIKFFNKNV